MQIQPLRSLASAGQEVESVKVRGYQGDLDPTQFGRRTSPRWAQTPELRDIGEVPAVEVVTTVALHLMSAAAVKVGLGDGSKRPLADSGAADLDLDEARTLIIALAGLITAGAPRLGTFHAAPLRDGLRTFSSPSARRP